MSASIEHHNMTLENYPGGFDPVDRSKYVFPSIRFYQASGSIKSWDIYVQACYGTAHAAHINEETGGIMPYELSPEMFLRDPAIAIYCRVVVTSTIKNPSITSKVLITEGSNIGRSNQKSVFHQALVEAYSRYWTCAKASRRFVVDSPHLTDTKINAVAEQSRFASQLIPPMLASNEEPSAWWGSHGGGKIYIQRKLNGTRALCSRFGKADMNPICYTRKNGSIELKNIESEMLSLTAAYPSVVFDGEIYAHGSHLQEISGAARAKKSSVPLNLHYHIYDIADLNLTFEERFAEYMRMAAETEKFDFRFIHFEPSTVCQSLEQAEALYEQFKEEKYEGAILRYGPGKYTPAYNDKRSTDICKWKPTYSSEFKCIGWAEGNGSARGMVATWTCEVTAISIKNLHGRKPPSPLVIGQTFGCSISAREEQKREWFQKFSSDPTTFGREYSGRYCTIEFYDVSRDGKPLQPHWTTFVDAVDETLFAQIVTVTEDY